MTARPVLGVDAGGTRSRAALALPDGTVIARAEGAGLDPTAGTDWRGDLGLLLAQLGAAVVGDVVAGAVLGMPFFSEVPEISTAQAEAAAALVRGPSDVVNDVAVAAAGALAGRPGVLVLSGTGSMAWAEGPAGQARAGGFGDIFGDEGSACDIGRRALQLTSWHIDGRAHAPELAAAVLARIGCAPGGLIGWAYGAGRSRAAVAALAEAVAALAAKGDAQAGSILTVAAAQLAAQARAAAQSAGLPAAFDWTHAGGTFASPVLLGGVTSALGRPPLVPRLPPLGGALLMAARRAGWTVTDGFLDRMVKDLAAPGGANEKDVA
jgi:N-acetylglucosamine kinase-like BadF-type ATPase